MSHTTVSYYVVDEVEDYRFLLVDCHSLDEALGQAQAYADTRERTVTVQIETESWTRLETVVEPSS